ncbi:MAG: WG repeat-containing protein [Bacteroidales bacterium]|nr:WG repeat-containing protein [Bacteroidales bacterium]
MKSTRSKIDKQDLETRFGHEYDSIGTLQSGIAKVKRGGMFGIINKSGKLLAPLEYEYISDFRTKLAVAEKNGKYCLLNTKGEEVTPCVYESMEERWYGDSKVPDFSYGLLKVGFEGKFGFIDKKGKIKIQAVYDQAENFVSPGQSWACKGGKWGMINAKGETIIDFILDEIHFERKDIGYIVVTLNGKVDVVDYSGNILSNSDLEEMHQEKNKRKQ